MAALQAARADGGTSLKRAAEEATVAIPKVELQLRQDFWPTKSGLAH